MRLLSDNTLVEHFDGVDWLPIVGPWPADYLEWPTHMGWIHLSGIAGDRSYQVFKLNTGEQAFHGDDIDD